MGLPYDSDQGRDHAAAITSVMWGQAYLTSCESRPWGRFAELRG